MSNNLYEEAIADARKIREVAEENAKKAILEAVTPKIRDFIESQILEQTSEKDTSLKDSVDSIDEVEEEETSETVELDESAIKALLNLIGEDTNDYEDNSRNVVELALSEAVSRLTNPEREKLFRMTQKIDESIDNLSSRDLYSNNEENSTMSKEKYYEIDLKALSEAVNEMDHEELHEEEEEGMPPEEDDDLLSDIPELGNEEEPAGDTLSKGDVEAQIAELIADLGLDLDDETPDIDIDDLDEAEPENLEEVFEIDPGMLRRELRKIKNRVNETKGAALADLSGGIDKDHEHHYGGKGSGNAGKGGSFGGGKPGKDVLAEMKEALRTQRRQKGALENKLTKYRSAVNTLREQLEELNLFNAKLLYVNKLLQNKNISESQKRSIVQALDEAKDLREAKVLYKSLTESFTRVEKPGRKTLSESAKLGGSSRTTRSASSKQATGEVNRWARLAGLK